MESGPVIGFFQTRDRLVLVGEDGGTRTDFGERLVSERIGTARGSRPHPAGRATRMALHDGRAFVGSGETFEVEVWSLDGIERLSGRRSPVGSGPRASPPSRTSAWTRRASCGWSASPWTGWEGWLSIEGEE